jgi:glycosyltransferase involved in cell wall biosynthesis
MSRAEPAPVSVVMAVRDAARYLGEAIESVLAQSFGDFEFLIFDDGSRDGSPEIAQGYAKRDPRIALYRGSTSGQTFWLREGVSRARGEWIARMDADDLSHPERFAKQVAYLREHPECVALGAKVRVIDPDRRPIRDHEVPLEHEEIERALLLGAGPLPHAVTMLRRQAVLAVGNYRPRYQRAQDVDLFLRLAEVGRLANLPEALLEWRRHPEAVGATQAREQRSALNQVIADALRRRGCPESARPLPDRPRLSQRDLWHEWARAALGAGHRSTARHYARLLRRHEPFALRSWRLWLRAALGISAQPLLQRLRRSRQSSAQASATKRGL